MFTTIYMYMFGCINIHVHRHLYVYAWIFSKLENQLFSIMHFQ